MPLIDGLEYTPAEAMAKGRCPECGRDLSISNATVEIKLHWPHGLDPTLASPAAIERAAMITQHFEALAAAAKDKAATS
jgi:hypothetical protein